MSEAGFELEFSDAGAHILSAFLCLIWGMMATVFPGISCGLAVAFPHFSIRQGLLTHFSLMLSLVESPWWRSLLFGGIYSSQWSVTVIVPAHLCYVLQSTLPVFKVLFFFFLISLTTVS